MNQKTLDQITDLRVGPRLNLEHLDFINTITRIEKTPTFDNLASTICARFPGLDEGRACEVIFEHGRLYEALGEIRIYEFVQGLGVPDK